MSLSVVFILCFTVAKFSISASVEQYTYNITLSTSTGLNQTTARVTIKPKKKIILAEIDDVPKQSIGGETYMNFAEKVLLIRSKDKTLCRVYPQFPDITFSKMVEEVKTAPPNNGRIRDVVCVVSPYNETNYKCKKEVDEFCKENNNNQVFITIVKDCQPYNPDDQTSGTYKFCILSGIQDKQGLSCNHGGKLEGF